MTIPYVFSRELPVVAEADVLVVGGGPGGFSAAVMASRQGCRVVLAEASNAPGGLAYLGEISPFMGNHLDGVSLDAPLYVDWNRRIWELEGRDPADFSPDIPLNHPLSKEVAMLAAESLLQEAQVRCLYHHTFFDVIQEDGRITAAVFLSKSGLCAVRASWFIDATGDGEVAFKAGCPFEYGNAEGVAQPMTLCFKMSGVDRARMPSREEINRRYDEAKARGELDCPRENVLWFAAPSPDAIHFNTTRVIRKSAVSGVELSEAEEEGRRQMLELIRFLRTVPGFEAARLSSVASQIGVRESRRILGLHYQTVEDFTQCRKYADSIARVRYAVDIHNPTGTGTTFIGLAEGEWYELSFRILVPRGCRNLLMGCRAVSVDHTLYSSLRIMPVVCSIGQAAGMGAALALRHQVENGALDSVEVHRRLIEAGARLRD